MSSGVIDLSHENERLQTLFRYNLLDTLPEESFDRLVALVAEFTDAPIAAFCLADENRIWFKSRYGIEIQELSREDSFCAHTVETDGLHIVEDALKDPRFSRIGIVAVPPHIRFYLGLPIHSSNGFVLGTLCILDIKPRTMSDKALEFLTDIAGAIETQLELRQLLAKE